MKSLSNRHTRGNYIRIWHLGFCKKDKLGQILRKLIAEVVYSLIKGIYGAVWIQSRIETKHHQHRLMVRLVSLQTNNNKLDQRIHELFSWVIGNHWMIILVSSIREKQQVKRIFNRNEFQSMLSPRVEAINKHSQRCHQKDMPIDLVKIISTDKERETYILQIQASHN